MLIKLDKRCKKCGRDISNQEYEEHNGYCVICKEKLVSNKKPRIKKREKNKILCIIIGIIMVIMPKMSLEILGVILSVILIINGVILMITDIKLNNNFIPVDMLPASMLSILLGIMMLIYPNILSIIIPLMLGTWFIMTSIFKIRLTLYLSKIQNTPWLLLMLISILSIVCGFILILNPIYHYWL